MSRRNSARGLLVMPVLGEASVVLAVQFLPIILLTIIDYAWYSAIYLGYAACLAIMLALLGDVWARVARVDAVDDRVQYYAVLTAISVFSGFGAVIVVGLVSHDLMLTGVSGAATAAAVYRSGSRYFLIVAGDPRRVGLADLIAGLLGSGITILLVASQNYSLHSVVLIWFGVNLISVVAIRARPVLSPHHVASWISQHRAMIRSLLGEAGLMNVASIGTPLIVGGIAGTSALALLRGATSLIYPVRLIMGAIRSRIVSGHMGKSRRAVSAVAATGAFLGLVIAVALMASSKLGFTTGSAAELLAEHSWAVATLAATTTLSTYFQFIARGILPGKTIIQRRLIHTVLMLSCTVTAAALFGASAIIWAASLATALTVPLWALCSRRGDLEPANAHIQTFH